jgi:hypothetical protein
VTIKREASGEDSSRRRVLRLPLEGSEVDLLPSLPARDLLLRVRKEIESHYNARPSGAIRHALRIRVGKELTPEESLRSWLTYAASERPHKPIFYDGRVHRTGLRPDPDLSIDHCFYGDAGASEAERFEGLAAQAMLQTWLYLPGQRIDYAPLDAQSFASPCNDEGFARNWMLYCYFLAWDYPENLLYGLKYYNEVEGDGGWGCGPFTHRGAYESLEAGEYRPAVGTYYLALDRDVRACSLEAIDAVLAMREGVGPDKAAPNREEIDHRYLGISTYEQKRRVRRRGHDKPIDFGGSRVLWDLFNELLRSGDDGLSKKQLKSVWSDQQHEQPVDSTFYDAISDLRRLVSPIGLTVRRDRLGHYALVDSEC